MEVYHMRDLLSDDLGRAALLWGLVAVLNTALILAVAIINPR